MSEQGQELNEIQATGSLKETEEEQPPVFTSVKQMWRNGLVICFGFMFLFTSFQSLGGLQSSLFKADGLGTASFATIYASLIVSAFFVPAPLISLLGCKWTIVVSMCCYILLMAAHFYATWGLFIPAAVLVGIGAAPLWTAKSTYLTTIAHSYAKAKGITNDAATNLFFGVFFLFFQSGSIWGNIISSQVLQPRDANASLIPPLSDQDLSLCGKNLCPAVDTGNKSNNTNLDKVPDSQLYTLAGTYTGCGVVAVIIIAVLLQVLPSDTKRERSCAKSCSPRLFVATFLHLKDYRQLLLIPLTMYSGLEQAFFFGDFTQAYVTCPLGKWWVGYIFICYGIVDSICSLTFGKLVEYVGRTPFFILGTCCHLAVQITLLTFTVKQTNVYIYFILAGAWGLADAIWQTQINALYGVLFKKNSDAAFSNYRLWESLGFVIAFGYQNAVCVEYKIYILMIALVLGITGYSVLEIITRRKTSYNVK